MTIQVKVPLLPESVSDATIATWHKKPGDLVSRDENIVDLETDKVMLEVPAPTDGVLKEIIKATGSTVQAQEVIAIIEASDGKAEKKDDKKNEKKTLDPAPKTAGDDKGETAQDTAKGETVPSSSEKGSKGAEAQSSGEALSPAARRRAATEPEKAAPRAQSASAETPAPRKAAQAESSSQDDYNMGDRIEKRVPMTRMRARIAERLLEVTQSTAMLTTFNEINMAPVMELRQRYKTQFEKKHQTKLGFMSFFVRACVEALKRSPIVNASIDGNDIVYHGYFDIGVAVSTDRGLVVPVLRNADQMSMAEIEAKIAEMAEKARAGKLAMEDMQGGTFTITNGGVFGSLMATPLLNSPQCAILGMHKIQERPVVENGQIVIRPMMYVALSYDHRLIDGKESVTFLVSVKELLEDPMRLILEV